MLLQDGQRLHNTSINEFLEGLPPATFDRLYAQPATCLAVLRLLPPLSKTILFRFLYCTEFVSQQTLQGWVFDKQAEKLRNNLERIQRLRILVEEKQGWKMNEVFRQNLHDALTGGGTKHSFGEPVEPSSKDYMSIEELDQYAIEKWETVLHFMVGTSRTAPSKAVSKLLRKGGLMKIPGEETSLSASTSPATRQRTTDFDDSNLEISSLGFQFLLMDVKSQVWTLLLEYLHLAETELDMDLVEVLNFVFMLGSLQLGQCYSTEMLTETQKTMLPDIVATGLIYTRKKKSKYFYPTRLATSLTSDSWALVSNTSKSNSLSLGHTTTTPNTDSDSTGFIILETNYRIYAYTSSPLQIAVLNLFCSLKARFRNMVVGMITRDSVRDALRAGITADQIIGYLRKHAHPEMKKNNPVLPLTVVDQMRLWELEKNRLTVSRGTLYTNFVTFDQFRKCLIHAQELGGVLWYNESTRMMVIKNEIHEQMKRMVKAMDKK